MNKKNLMIGIAVALIPTALGISSVFAYQGDYSVQGPNYTEERELSMTEVMESKDYEEWKTLMIEDGRNPGVLSKVDTQEKFDQFAEAYILGKEGKTDEANAIRSELGLGNGGNAGANRGRGNSAGINQDGVCNQL